MADTNPSNRSERFSKERPAPTFSRVNVRVLLCEDSVVIQKLVFQVLKEAAFSKPQINQTVGCIDNLIHEKHEQRS
jgi:hypothetical protein